jgi:hypothetical protein
MIEEMISQVNSKYITLDCHVDSNNTSNNSFANEIDHDQIYTNSDYHRYKEVSLFISLSISFS